MIPGQIMRVCRECPDNNLPECGKGKCPTRDAYISRQRESAQALTRDKAANAAFYGVLTKSKGAQR